MEKKQAAKTLGLTADILELLGENEFRVLAYRKAERMLERFDGDWDTAVANGYRNVPGVGAQIATAFVEFDETGVFAPLSDVASQVPPGVLELFQVRGLGPKKIKALWMAGVSSLEALLEACRAGRVAALKGFGAGTQAKLLESAEFVLASSERRHVNVAELAFESLRAHLEGVVTSLQPGGSLRRGFETVGDLDAVAVGDRDEVMRALQPFAPREDERYPWLIQAKLQGFDLQLSVNSPETFGAGVVVMIGSKPYLQHVWNAAKAKGLELDSRALTRNGEVVPTPDEASVFAALGVPYRIPEWREPEHDGLEGLPDPANLVQLEHLRGMLHVHTSYSDGSHSVRQMAEASRALGMTHIGICDHSKSAAYAGGLEPHRVRQQWQEIDAVNAELEGIRILKGIESDILPDGSLDYDDDLLEGFDFVVASIHSSFNLSERDQTERLVRAVSNPFTTILGHPTGRLLLRRPPYKFDLDAVLDAAEAHRTVIEINANAYRLDLDWRDVLQARNRVRFAVNTDAHHTDGLRDLKFGVRIARKGALERDNVINTWDVARLLELVQAKRK